MPSESVIDLRQAATPATAPVQGRVGVDAQALERALRGRLRGEVRFDRGSRALYATDASNYRQLPIGVVIPRDTDEVVATVEECHRHGAPLLSRGGGTSLAGQCCNTAVVMDLSKCMNRILWVDPERRLARVQPGVVLDELRAAAEEHGLTFAPDPATHDHNTLGGMIGNNSCGVHSVMGGRTADNIESLEVLTYDGERLEVGATGEDELADIIAAGGRRGDLYRGLRELRDRYAGEVRARYPDIPRRVSGYNLDELLSERGFQLARALVGSESTCVTVLEATVRLVPSPPHRVLLVLGYPDVYAAGDAVPWIMRHGPVGLEGLDRRLIRDMKESHLHEGDLPLLPEGDGFLLVEFGADSARAAEDQARALMETLEAGEKAPAMRLHTDPADQKRVWGVRESGLGATYHPTEGRRTWPGWEDAAVPPDRVGDYLRDFRSLLDRYGYHGDLYGHFGQGCIHVRIDFDLESEAGIARYRDFVEEAADLVTHYGGALSGEHGDGQARGELLARMYGEELVQAFVEFKSLWDPDWKMNPGKVVLPYPVDANLRLGAHFDPTPPATRLSYPDDGGSFMNAALRCVGVGKCRRHAGGVMCPSYRATREEAHSTRGRARLLFEMLNGELRDEGWKSEAVRESLDLCLACKGCKSDCPINVDMATYKAEFMSHYYRGRLRPRQAYAFGLIDRWARMGGLAPGLFNRLTHTPGLEGLARRLAGIDPIRELPRLARPFTRDHRSGRPLPPLGRATRPRAGGPGRRGEVLLWPDTFNNHFHPDSLKAAVEVLQAAGYQVRLPPAGLCCGRPLYDYGMLDLARARLRRILHRLGDDIGRGLPLVGLEPSCLSVLRDEARQLLPEDDTARRLGEQTWLLEDFLDEVADWTPPQRPGRALVHRHCHRKALFGEGGQRRLFERCGLEAEWPEPGCCGMAGAFGFERGKAALARTIGEQGLLPAVRAAQPDTLILADGYSCREQIRQETGRAALHPAELLASALDAD